MQVGVMEQIGAPGMEHGEKADFSTQLLGISGDSAQSLRGGPEQNAVEFSLVLIGNCCNLLRHREHKMEVPGVQKLGFSILEPLSPRERLAFWAVPIRAGVIGVALMAAVVTLFQMATKNSSPADLDRCHDAMLRHRHRSAILQAIICAVAAEYIRYFESRPIHFTPPLYKYLARVGLSSAPSGCGSRSSGLLVEQTLVVAMRR
jgi:hypothetical protein